MERWFLPFLVLVLMALACGRGNPAEWQPQSDVLPQIEAQTQLRLFIQPAPGDGALTLLDPLTAQTRSETWTRAANLATVLAGEYQVVGDVLLGGGGEFFGLSSGVAAPTGLWLAVEEQTGLYLYRVDGAGMLLSSSGQFPVWSPDGSWLGYRDAVGVWGVNVSADLTPQQLSNTTYEPLSWSADNHQLLLRNGATAVILDILSEIAATLRGVDASQMRGHPIWAPDGQTIYVRYGNNGLLNASSAHRQPDNVQARLIAITLDGSGNPIRDVLPNRRDWGISEFLLSPDGNFLVTRHFRCSTGFGNGLFPFIPQRGCSGSLILVEVGTGYYQTLSEDLQTGAMAWEQLHSPVNLADLPLPSHAEPVSGAEEHPFWQPDAAPGQNPATALPLGVAGEKLGTLTTVISVVEGETALALALDADPRLLPPSPGYVYIAVRQRVSATTSGSLSIFFSPRTMLVDDRLAAHAEVAWLDAGGKVLPELRYSADAPAEYWQLFILEAEARPWLLYAPAGADNQPDLYFRLDETAVWEAPAVGVEALSPNKVGVSEPAGTGETAVSSSWQITLLPTDPATRPAMTSELVQVQIAYTGGLPKANRLLTCLGSGAFQDVAGGTVGQDVPAMVLPFQTFYRPICLLPGGLFRGWLVVLPGEAGAVFRFNPPNAGPVDERLFVYEESE